MVDPKHAEMMDRIHTESERDRLAAENAELKRRLEKVVKATNSLAPECHCCDYNADEWCLVCEGIDEIVAIAEGRNNG